MRRALKYLIFIFFVLTQNLLAAEIPNRINGFALDADVEEYKHLLKTETALPIRFMEYLKEIEIQRRSGFKSGYLAYGNCSSIGKIARIKLKYDDSSKDFYEKLLKKFKERFGNPSEWQGDPFHIVLAWKWDFFDKGEHIELYLQHNTMNSEKKLGNSVKITNSTFIAAEQKCFTEKYPDFRKSSPDPDNGMQHDWGNLIPE